MKFVVFSQAAGFMNNISIALETYVRDQSIWENRLDGDISDDCFGFW